MQIKNLQLKAMEARRYQSPDGRPMQIRIDHNSSVTLFAPAGENEANIEFQYTASYGPLGVIKIEGSMLINDANAHDAAGKWASSRQLEPEFAKMIHNSVMQACVPQAVGLAKDIRLPPPIPLPTINVGQQKASVSGSQLGPEFA
ncbi:MAG: hypothetical protein CVT48_03660 [Thermoplasmata archaeon HGW-Thermoplasmata-1]|nr:MAG: hypothetical protein CVT48_03660 [Thermoplasmata archaeon HGW-Thermoplasmata-1]